MRLAQRFILLALLAASGGAGAAQPGLQQASQAQGFVQAPQKPVGAGISIRYRIVDTVTVGRPTRVEIVLGRIADPGGAVANLRADATLQLESGTGPYSFQAGQDGLLQVTVVPKVEGLAYLNLFVTQHGATSSTSIAIEAGEAGVGPNTKGAQGKLKELPEGQKILSMPVK